jgi:hypothetical protein
VAVKRGDRWQIALFQNTPAAWHGREDDANALTAELQAAFENNGRQAHRGIRF